MKDRIARTAVAPTAACVAALMAASATASELVYKPVNPAFGGRPLNGSFLLGTAQAQNDHKDPERRRRDDDPAAQFLRALESRLLSGLANQVTEAIFGEDAADSGTIVFDQQTITFQRGLEAISIEIVDASTGNTTVIELPTLQLD